MSAVDQDTAASLGNGGGRATTMEREQASRFLRDLLRLMLTKGGSDLFLTADFPPAFKIDGNKVRKDADEEVRKNVLYRTPGNSPKITAPPSSKRTLPTSIPRPMTTNPPQFNHQS